MSRPEVLRSCLLQMQVCVPEGYTDEQVEDFSNINNPTGISSQWTIRQEIPVRAQCEERTGCVHLILTC